MFCSKCGKELKEDAVFCDDCGTPTTAQSKSAVQKSEAPNIPTVLLSYIISILTTIASFYLRVANWEFLDKELKLVSIVSVYGISPDKKTLMAFLPIAALILVFLLIGFDKKLSSKKKIKTLCFAILFAVVSLLLICCTGIDESPFNIFSRLFW